MDAKDNFLVRYLEGSDKKFVIPVYQRNYDWKKEQCKQLFDDILGIITHEYKSYFIGSIVNIYDDAKREFVIIDGQQRITSLSILLLAIYNLLERGAIETSTTSLKEQINETYLVNKYAEDEKRIRLKPIKDDNIAFLKLFDNNVDEYIQNSNITINYLYFEERIMEACHDGTAIDLLYEAIKKLMIVDVRLVRGEDNPQLIFESLNSTGKKLDEADLVRNFILMDKPPESQEKFYEKFWHPIEKNTDYRVADFIRDYLTYASGKTPRKDKVYAAFKIFVNEKINSDELSLEELLGELLMFSKFYKQFLFFDTANDAINLSLKRIARLQVSVAYPYLLDVFHVWSENIIDENAVIEILSLLEAFVLRRFICNVATNGLNKLFATLGKNIRKIDGYKAKYLEIFKYLISTGTTSSRFPNDEEFREALATRDVYNLKAKNRIHLFERLENFNNREKVDVEGLIEANKEGLTFEHIMPQTLTSKWKADLGERFAYVHDTYLHRLGNLTLTAYNSELTNKPFEEKLNKENGFKDSRLWLNQSLQGLSSWGEDEISQRGALLVDRAVNIWKFPQSTYVPVQKIDTQLGIYDDDNFTGTKPKTFILFEEEYQVRTWRELYQKTAQLLYKLDSIAFEQRVSEPDSARYMASDPQFFRNSWELGDNIYLETDFSTDGIIGALKYLFEAFNIDENDFFVVLK